MIPYRIFIAAVLTLIIVLNKMALNKPRYKRLNPMIFKMTMGVIYILATFYWILSIFAFSAKWYSYVISGIIAFAAFIYYYFVYLYTDKTKKSKKVFDDYTFLVGKTGKVTSKYLEGYIGNLDETNEMVFINSHESLEVGDDFQISELTDSKIFAVKYGKK